MAMKLLSFLLVVAASVCAAKAQGMEDAIHAAFGEVEGAFVLRNCESGEETVFRQETADTAFGPCSTFKIWNSLIGLEVGIITGPDDPFWKWDGEERGFPGWNKDQTWRSAFAVSCVPAFQNLARKIGAGRMQSWLDKLGYGNRDMAGRPAAFWLPRAGEKTVMITPREQAAMICRLLNGKLPVKAGSIAALTDVMKLQVTDRGTLYGKTGSGLRSSGNGPEADADFDMGWLVGFVESGGKKYAYACLVLGPGLGGKDARLLTESVFKASGLL
ncbi:MAG: class D beta-lactamase [Chthoniobacterales bacterium]|nr:class D beta-lactamase [Chthoniobacterales bacterium]